MKKVTSKKTNKPANAKKSYLLKKLTREGYQQQVAKIQKSLKGNSRIGDWDFKPIFEYYLPAIPMKKFLAFVKKNCKHISWSNTPDDAYVWKIQFGYDAYEGWASLYINEMNDCPMDVNIPGHDMFDDDMKHVFEELYIAYSLRIMENIEDLLQPNYYVEQKVLKVVCELANTWMNNVQGMVNPKCAKLVAESEKPLHKLGILVVEEETYGDTQPVVHTEHPDTKSLKRSTPEFYNIAKMIEDYIS